MFSRDAGRRKKTSTRICIFLFFLLFLATCSGGLFSTPVGKIQASPREYDGKQVTVKGTVTESASLLFVKYFLLKDETGEIPVVTERILPRKGEIVSVTGNVQEAFAFGDKQVIVIVESSK